MGTAANTAEQTPTETTPEHVEALLEVQHHFHYFWLNLFGVLKIALVASLSLSQAARYDDLDDVVSLATAGVFLDSKDSLGRTALHMAAANGHLDIVEYLVNRGVDLNAFNEEKNTPLHWACLNGHIEVVKKLILAGANVSVLNSYERTPMDEAVSRDKGDVIDAINAAVALVELAGIRVS
ncbi:hypothetical protein FH972_009848 [Carpinus fangiana]|uniref:PGG domain-containing protein n=1 Tax=Carpinus fangiana TaxID=176857 RepID=A0A660KNG5_9ROSI|nr:hypothetical protein FH972_009848 [Carpinus fangiana]